MKLLKVSLAIVFLAALLMVSFGVYATGGPVYGGTLTIALDKEPPGLDPTTNTAAVIDRVLYKNVYEGLVTLNREGEIVPLLAEDYEISNDGLEYTFYLREGVKFHDGHELTAADVIYTFERNLDPDVPIVHAAYYGDITKMEAVNNYAVKFTLAQPNSMLLFRLAIPDGVIVPLGAGDELKSQPNGTGPFRFAEWARGDHITLGKFDAYHNEKLPYLDKVIFKVIPDPSVRLAALKTGGIDVIGWIVAPENALEFEGDPALKVLRGNSTGDVILAINNSREPLNDVRVRRAISYAIDQEEIIEATQFGFGTPIASHMSPVNPNYIDLTWLYPHNPDKARELLAEAGYPNGFSLDIRVPSDSYCTRGAESVKDQLEQVGIELNVEVLEFGVWLEQVFRNAQYDLSIVRHTEAFDIDIYARPTYYFRYDNPQFQEVIKKALLAVDVTELRQLYAIAQWTIASDAVNGFLYEAAAISAMRKEIMNWWEDYPESMFPAVDVWIAP